MNKKGEIEAPFFIHVRIHDFSASSYFILMTVSLPAPELYLERLFAKLG